MQKPSHPEKTVDKTRGHPLVVSYHPNLPHLPALTWESLPILHASHRLQQAIPEPPILAYHRSKNLHNLFCQLPAQSINSKPHHGSSSCGNRCCLTCQQIHSGETYVSTTTGQTYVSTTTGQPFHVRATASILIIKCEKQYVGETQSPPHQPQRTPQ